LAYSHNMEEYTNIEFFKTCYHQIISHKKIFKTRQTQESALDYITGLISAHVQRKNTWQIAQNLGQSQPYRFQNLLYHQYVDHQLLRDTIQQEAIHTLGTAEAVLCFDETTFVKKGERSVGVGRQYCGRLGKIENCQAAVFMNYSTNKGHLLIDTKLLIKKEWFEDSERCAQAKIPQDMVYQGKGELALELFKEFKRRDGVASFVTGDSLYGNCPKLRQYLEENQQHYVFSIPSNFYLLQRVDYPNFETAPWTTYLSQEPGEKGLLKNEWLDISFCALPNNKEYRLLVRRTEDEQNLLYYLAYVEKGTDASCIIEAIHRRWTIETDFRNAKSFFGLADYEVRSYHGWYRHMSFCLFGILLTHNIKAQLEQKLQSHTLQIEASFDSTTQSKSELSTEVQLLFGKKTPFIAVKKNFNQFLQKRGLGLNHLLIPS